MRLVDIPNRELVRALVRAPVIVNSRRYGGDQLIVMVYELDYRMKESVGSLIIIRLTKKGEIVNIYDARGSGVSVEIDKDDLYDILRKLP